MKKVNKEKFVMLGERHNGRIAKNQKWNLDELESIMLIGHELTSYMYPVARKPNIFDIVFNTIVYREYKKYILGKELIRSTFRKFSDLIDEDNVGRSKRK